LIKCALAVFIGVIQYFLLKYGIVSEWIFDDPERGVAAAFIVIAAVGWIVMNGLFSSAFGRIGRTRLYGRYGSGRYAVFFPIQDNIFALMICGVWTFYLFTLVDTIYSSW